MAVETRQIITDDDLLAPGEDVRVEVINGELIIYPMTANKAQHGATGANIISFLSIFVKARKLGRVFSDMTAFKLKLDDEGGIKGALVPDAAFVSIERMALDEPLNVILRVVPELVIEVISESDTFTEVIDKTNLYLDYGVPHVWLVIPARREVRVFSPANRAGTLFGENDALSGDGALAGFAVPVKAIFDDEDSDLQVEVMRRLLG